MALLLWQHGDLEHRNRQMQRHEDKEGGRDGEMNGWRETEEWTERGRQAILGGVV